jgi:small subunit ribosomal protein S2
MPAASMRELLEAGVHFGHQTRRWNPKMRRFIYAERSGIYVIDLQKTQGLLERAYDFVAETSARGGSVLFVGTKKQARDAVRDHATRVGQPYINHRWLGGLLTNFRTISDRLTYLHDLRRLKDEGQLDLLPTKERLQKLADLEKLETNIGGVADMRRLPSAIFVIDLKAEELAVREARRLKIPLIGLVDTNADPDEVDFVIPGNDDAIRACQLLCRVIADGVAEGRGVTEAAEAAERAAAEAAAAAEADGDAGGDDAAAAEADAVADAIEEPAVRVATVTAGAEPEPAVAAAMPEAAAPEAAAPEAAAPDA